MKRNMQWRGNKSIHNLTKSKVSMKMPLLFTILKVVVIVWVVSDKMSDEIGEV